jgi:hypothetical protein
MEHLGEKHIMPSSLLIEQINIARRIAERGKRRVEESDRLYEVDIWIHMLDEINRLEVWMREEELKQTLPPGGWIGVDLDGTLAHYESGQDHIGEPVEIMVDRVRKWIAQGYYVRILTARLSGPRNGVPVAETKKKIEDWCLYHLGFVLPVTCIKGHGMLELWDDRAVGVERNTGMPKSKSTRGLD